jgi:arabinofuranosyltransferase
MMLFSAVYACTGEAFFSSIVFSLLVLLCTLWVIHWHILRGTWAGVLALIVLGWSLSFVEYSTSGLENVLNGFLLMLFYALWLRRNEAQIRPTFALSLVAAFGLVSRMDTAVLYAPALLVWLWQERNWRTLRAMCLGFLPFLLWEAFAIFYYGFPFPNTAYAKLNGGISQATYFQHGLWYYLNGLRRDPITLVVTLAGIFLCFLRGERRLVPLGLGVLLYSVYVLRIGGDFMAGRFFYLPFLGGMVLLSRSVSPRRWGSAALLAALLVGVVNPKNPWYNGWRSRPPQHTIVDAHGIADERSWYQEGTTLTAVNDTLWAFVNERKLDASPPCDSAEKGVLFWDFLGYMGYGLGPCTSICDKYALADPLLARLPASDVPDWRIGHLERVFPRGYRESLRQDTNLLSDPELHVYYDHLRRVTRGPLWSAERLSSIWQLNNGSLDTLIDKDFYRSPSPLRVTLSEVSKRHPYGEPYGTAGQTPMFDHRPLTIDLGGPQPWNSFEVSLRSYVHYNIQWMSKGEILEEHFLQGHFEVDGLAIDTLVVPPAHVGKVDAITIIAGPGNEFRSLGHLVPLR